MSESKSRIDVASDNIFLLNSRIASLETDVLRLGVAVLILSFGVFVLTKRK